MRGRYNVFGSSWFKLLFAPRSMLRVVSLIVALSALAFSGLAQATPEESEARVDAVYMARDDGNGKAGDEVTEFSVKDVPIWCIVLLATPAKATVKMNFVAVKVNGVRPETKVVSSSYTTKENQNRVNFNGRPEGLWTPGRYRVDIFLDGKAAKTLEFDIKGSGAAAGSNGFVPPSRPKPKAKRPGSKYLADHP